MSLIFGKIPAWCPYKLGPYIKKKVYMSVVVTILQVKPETSDLNRRVTYLHSIMLLNLYIMFNHTYLVHLTANFIWNPIYGSWPSFTRHLRMGAGKFRVAWRIHARARVSFASRYARVHERGPISNANGWVLRKMGLTICARVLRARSHDCAQWQLLL